MPPTLYSKPLEPSGSFFPHYKPEGSLIILLPLSLLFLPFEILFIYFFGFVCLPYLKALMAGIQDKLWKQIFYPWDPLCHKYDTDTDQIHSSRPEQHPPPGITVERPVQHKCIHNHNVYQVHAKACAR